MYTSHETVSRILLTGLCLLMLLGTGPASAESRARMTERKAMVKEIEADVRDTSIYIDREELDPRVMKAMRDVPRHEFVPDRYDNDAYLNMPLPIGHGQTISQPYIVALMTDLVGAKENDRILEIGTGSGYQAAILAELAGEVYSIEIVEQLADDAKERLRRLDYKNIQLKFGDGYHGWPEYAPYDAIVVTAASSHIPPPLVEQLKPGGRMVIPVGSRFMVQYLTLLEKDEKGEVTTKQLLPVRFVPLTGDH